jgi:hypothetical protein
MGILQITTDEIGQVAELPRRVKIITTDALAVVTAAGYLNPISLLSNTIYPSDVIDLVYSWSNATQSGTYEVFLPSFSGSTITLVAWVDPGNVLLPVVANDFANFNGTTGQLKDAGYSPSDPAKTKVVMATGATVANHLMVSTDTAGTVGNKTGTAINDGSVQAGRDTVAGSLISYPATTATGFFSVTGISNSGAFNGILSNVALGQTSTWSLPDPANAAARILVAATATPFTTGRFPVASGTGGLMVDSGVLAANLDSSLSSATATTNKVFVKTITATAAALATSGHVAVMAAPSGTSQFKILNIRVMYAAAGLSGGGGDRLLTLTDGTIVFNQAGITAALLGTPIWTLWGGTGNPIPATVSTISTAGAEIYLVYSGGAADYTTGQIVIEVELAQVTA